MQVHQHIPLGKRSRAARIETDRTISSDPPTLILPTLLVHTAPPPLFTNAVTMVKVVGTKAEFDEILASAGDKAVVVDFYATWCGPCKVIAPYYEELSKQFTDVFFIKVSLC